MNDQLYLQCPVSLTLGKYEDKFLVETYFDCRENNTYPSPGGLSRQTAFTRELFSFCDQIVNNYKNKQLQKQKNQQKQQERKNRRK